MSLNHEIEPMWADSSRLTETANAVIRAAARLEGSLPLQTRRALAQSIRVANTYYSNLIEGHDSTLRELDNARAGHWATESARRSIQEEAIAHLAVLSWQDEWSRSPSAPRPTDPLVLAELHRRFYDRMPPEYRLVTIADSGRRVDVGPGEVRTETSTVAGHHAPDPEDIDHLLRHFDLRFRPDKIASGVPQLLAAAASHQRLLWIHPFRDGNGRVARLFTDAYLRTIQLDAEGIWTPTRGFARDRREYYSRLGAADSVRISDSDGRGGRSTRHLEEWCFYFLTICLDQIEFITERLQPVVLLDRIKDAIKRDAMIPKQRLKDHAVALLDILLRHGSMTRTDLYRAFGLSERTGRNVLRLLNLAGWIGGAQQDDDARVVRVSIAVPLRSLPIVCPDLFPVQALDGLESLRKS